jgi:hypothetical protein
MTDFKNTDTELLKCLLGMQKHFVNQQEHSLRFAKIELAEIEFELLTRSWKGLTIRYD